MEGNVILFDEAHTFENEAEVSESIKIEHKLLPDVLVPKVL